MDCCSLGRGDDPECKDDLIGGEIKMHMTLTRRTHFAK